MDETQDSGGSWITSLSDLAGSFVDSVGSSVTDAVSDRISDAIAGDPSPAPDVASQAATPGAKSKINLSSVSLPVILVGGALVALLVLKRR